MFNDKITSLIYCRVQAGSRIPGARPRLFSPREASRSLDVGETVLRRWVQQLQSERSGTTPISKALTPEQQKIQELEARINRLEREKDILKKATALLMADEFTRTR